jgi:protein N-terminal methyltransferase
VSNYLTDDDFVDFLVKCKNSLENGGIIVVKENMSQDGIIFDSDDTSVTRSDKLYKEIFKHAGL